MSSTWKNDPGPSNVVPVLLVCVLLLTAVIPDLPDINDNDVEFESSNSVTVAPLIGLPQAAESFKPSTVELPTQISSPIRT